MTGLEYLQSLTDDQLISLYISRDELTEQNIKNLAKNSSICFASFEGIDCFHDIKGVCFRCAKEWLSKGAIL